MVVCKRVVYAGRVQGVGFRYTTQHLAEDFPVAGHVRNLAGGEVEVIVEGEADEVQGFLTAIERHMAGYIREQRVQDQSPMGLYGFVIRA